MTQTLSAFGSKRLADMDRAELEAVIQSLWRSLMLVNSRTIGVDRMTLPDSEVDQFQAVLEQWFTSGASNA